jgi:hypothetical protein
VLEVEDLRVDTRARRIERAGRPIQLTTKEYALLEYLARHRGGVVGRAEIAEHVLDDSFDPMSHLIEVYIQRLRRKVDDGYAVKLAVKNLQPQATFTFVIDGTDVATAITDRQGRVEVELDVRMPGAVSR